MDRPDSGTNACHPWRLALFVVVALSGCSPSSEAPLVVAERLFERTDPRQAGEARECAVGDEIRPALGCAEIVTLHQARARPDGKRPYLVGPV